MRKQEFIYQLWKKLSDLPKEEVEERLSFYGEMIDDRMEDGLSEEEAVAAIGSADEIASLIIEEIPLNKIVRERIKPKRRLRAWEIVLLVLGAPIWIPMLVVVPLSVTVSLYAVLWSAVVALWAVFVALVASAAVGLICGVGFSFVNSPAVGISLIGVSLICAGLSVFIFFGCMGATKGAALLAKKIVLGIKNLLVKKEAAQ